MDWTLPVVVAVVVVVALLGRLFVLLHWLACNARNAFMREVALDLVRAAARNTWLTPEAKEDWVRDMARVQYRVDLTEKEIGAAVYIVEFLEGATSEAENSPVTYARRAATPTP